MINYKPPLPSSLLQDRESSDFNYKKNLTNNIALRVGVVIDVIEVDAKENTTNISTEYTVMAIQDQNNVIYSNCIAIDGFGGVADFFNKKLRATTHREKTYKKTDVKTQNGSIVMLLCIDGNAEQAVIIGSISHPDRKTGKLTKALGHHAEGEFNGVNWKIDKDGALTITFKSATDNDGKAADTKAGGTHLKMDKTGSVDINTNLTGDDETYIRMDKTNKDVGLKAGRHVGITAKQNIGITAKKNISTKATADLLAEAGGSFTAKSGGAFKIDSAGPLSLKAPDMKIAVDNMFQVKASTVSISAPSIMLGDGATPAVIMTTQVMAIGNLGAPTIGIMIGPFSSSVGIAP